MIKVTSIVSTHEKEDTSLPALYRFTEDPALTALFFSEFSGMVVTPAETCPRFRGLAAGELRLDVLNNCFGSSWERLPKGTKFTLEQG